MTLTLKIISKIASITVLQQNDTHIIISQKNAK